MTSKPLRYVLRPFREASAEKSGKNGVIKMDDNQKKCFMCKHPGKYGYDSCQMFLTQQLESDLYQLCEAHMAECGVIIADGPPPAPKETAKYKGDVPQIAKELFGKPVNRNFYEREPGEEG